MEASLESSNALDSFLSDLNSTMATVGTSMATNEVSSVSTENYSMLKSRSDIEEDAGDRSGSGSGSCSGSSSVFDPFAVIKSTKEGMVGTNGSGFDCIDFVTSECKPSAPVEAKQGREALLIEEEAVSHGNYFSDSESNSLVIGQERYKNSNETGSNDDAATNLDAENNNESTAVNASTLTQENFSDLHFDDDGDDCDQDEGPNLNVSDNKSNQFDSSSDIHNISTMTSSFQVDFNVDDKLLSFDNGNHFNDNNDEDDEDEEDDENAPVNGNGETPKQIDESSKNQTRNECEDALNESDSEDEWNYYRIVKKSDSSSSVIERNRPPPDSDSKSDKSEQHEEEQQQQQQLQHTNNSEEDMLSNEEGESRLNPNAAEFVPQSPKRNPIENFFNDPIISQSPKGVPLDLNIRNFSEKEIISDLKCMPSDENVQLEQIKDVYGNLVINNLFAVKKSDESEEEKDSETDRDDAVIDLNETRELPTNFEYEEIAVVENDKENDQPETSDIDADNTKSKDGEIADGAENGKMKLGGGDCNDDDGDNDGDVADDADFGRCTNSKNDFSTNTTTESISKSFEEIENSVKNLSFTDEVVKPATESNALEAVGTICGASVGGGDGNVNGIESYAEIRPEIEDYVLLPADVSATATPVFSDDFKVESQISDSAAHYSSSGSNENLVMEIAEEYEIVNNESCISVQENQQMFDGLERDSKHVEVADVCENDADKQPHAVDRVAVAAVPENAVDETNTVSAPQVDLESPALSSSLPLSDSQVADMEAAAHCLVDMKSSVPSAAVAAEELPVADDQTKEELAKAVSESKEVKAVTSEIAETGKQTEKSEEKGAKKALGQQPRKNLVAASKSAAAVPAAAKKPLAAASRTTLASVASARSRVATASGASTAAGVAGAAGAPASASRGTTIAHRAITKSKVGAASAAPAVTTARPVSVAGPVAGATKTATTASGLSRPLKSSATASSVAEKRAPLNTSKRTTATATSTTTTTTMSTAFGSSKRTVTGIIGSYSAIGKPTSAKTQVSSLSPGTKRPASRPAATTRTATTATATSAKRALPATATAQIRVKSSATTVTAARRTAAAVSASATTTASSSPLSNGLKPKVPKASTTATAASSLSAKKLSATFTTNKASSLASRTTSTFARKTDTTATKATGSATTAKKLATTATTVASSVPKAVPRNLAPKAAPTPVAAALETTDVATKTVLNGDACNA